MKLLERELEALAEKDRRESSKKERWGSPEIHASLNMVRALADAAAGEFERIAREDAALLAAVEDLLGRDMFSEARRLLGTDPLETCAASSWQDLLNDLCDESPCAAREHLEYAFAENRKETKRYLEYRKKKLQ